MKWNEQIVKPLREDLEELGILKDSYGGREGETYIVFLPIGDDKKIAIDDGSFGVYTTTEFNKTNKPHKKWSNYTTSYTFSDIKIAKAYEKLVIQAKGDMKSPSYKKALQLDKKGK
jgi:hypothetical protein